MFGWTLLAALALVFLGSWLVWPHSKTWGYEPGGILAVLVMVMVLLLTLGSFMRV